MVLLACEFLTHKLYAVMFSRITAYLSSGTLCGFLYLYTGINYRTLSFCCILEKSTIS